MNEFWRRVDKRGPVHPRLRSRCWIWTGTRTDKGYGNLMIGGRWIRAHRISWTLGSPIPRGVCVLHKCDRRHCVRPSHLFLGTQADNMRDMWTKGRGVVPMLAGQDHPSAKLTDAKVRRIRRLLAAGLTGLDIAKRVGISNSTVSLIKLDRIWRRTR